MGTKFAKASKMADMVKNISSKYITEIAPQLEEEESNRPLPENIDDLAQSSLLSNILGSTVNHGILLPPKEFQRIILISRGFKDTADQLNNHNTVFGPSNGISPVNISNNPPESLSKITITVCGDSNGPRSWFPNGLGPRISAILRNRPRLGMKETGGLGLGLGPRFIDEKPPLGLSNLPVPGSWLSTLLDIISSMYNDYRQKVIQAVPRVTAMHGITPGVVPLLHISRMFGPTTNIQKAILETLTKHPDLADIITANPGFADKQNKNFLAQILNS